MLCVKTTRNMTAKLQDCYKKNAMHVNPKYKWFMKKQIGKKHWNWKFFQFWSIEHWLNINRVRLRAMIKNQGIFDRSKNTFNRSKFWKFEFLKTCRRLCWNNSTKVISWMKCIRMSLNVFQKHEFSTQNFKIRFLIIKKTIFANP